MLKRKIDEYFVNWLNRAKRKSLIIDGPRQTGKTFSVKNFITNHFDENRSFYVDFQDNYRLSRIFKRDLDVSRIYQEIQLIAPEKRLVEGESIIFFDNIQLCPEILPYFRAFTEDGLYSVIAAGSSLDIIFNSVAKYPVGFFDRYHMDSLDFEEYLWANEYDTAQVDYFKDLYHDNELKESSIHGVLLDYFREYMAIGGMPEVVNEYIKQNNFKLAFDTQRKILETYYIEMEVLSKHTLFPKIVQCFESLPSQLTKDNKKFQYRLVTDKGRASMYQSSVDWLIESGMVIRSHNLLKPIRPLNGNMKEQVFKLYMHDPGLLVAMYGEDTQLEILKGNFKVKNGAVLENTVATMLHRNNYDLYYFERNSTLEIDFVINLNLEVTPLVVKEADNPKCKTLKSIEHKYGIYNGLKLSCQNSLEGTSKDIIPVYIAMNLEK